MRNTKLAFAIASVVAVIGFCCLVPSVGQDAVSDSSAEAGSTDVDALFDDDSPSGSDSSAPAADRLRVEDLFGPGAEEAKAAEVQALQFSEDENATNTGGEARSDDLSQFSFHVGGMGQSRNAAAEARKQQKAARELLTKYTKTSDAGQKSMICQQLHKVVQQQFAAQQAKREAELKALEQQVRRLRELHDRRNAAAEDIVQTRVEQLLRQASGLGWASPFTGRLNDDLLGGADDKDPFGDRDPPTAEPSYTY